VQQTALLRFSGPKVNSDRSVKNCSYTKRKEAIVVEHSRLISVIEIFTAIFFTFALKADKSLIPLALRS